jgi:type 1 glutamine amidotransferase
MARTPRPGSRRTDRRAATLAPLALLALLALGGCSSSTKPAPLQLRSCAAGDPAPAFSVLVFTRTAGYVHESIPDGVAALRALGRVTGFSVDETKDPTRFTDTGLAPYRAVVFLSTTGDVLDDTQQGALERYVGAGHGWVGIHSASDTEYGWPWYQTMLGAHFTDHPAIQRATVIVVDTAHGSTRSLPATQTRTDEWYNFNQQPVGARVLVRVDEGSYSGGSMGAMHPVSWLHQLSSGRAWYTAMGHTSSSYSEIPFLEHLRGGILWAAGMESLTTCPL